MIQPRAPRLLVALVVATGVVLAACSGGGSGPTPTPVPSSTAVPSPSGTPAGSAAATTLALADQALGSIVVDDAGRSLYIFTKDVKGNGTSVCTAYCAATWPPLLADAGGAASAADGITGSLGTATRDDGRTQVTLDGWPLYYFAGDAAAGDTKGQSLNGVWWVVDGDGRPIGAPSGGVDGY